jgi:ribosome-associated translation inhibitor RaiA
MEIPLQITFRGMAPSDAIDAAIRDKARRLEHFYGRVTGCHVIVDAPHRHRRKGEVYRVTVDLTLPGREIVVSREAGRDSAHEDLYVALRDAFVAATRQLEDYVRVRRGDVKATPAAGRNESSLPRQALKLS